MNAVIGALRVDLGFDGREFVRGVADAQSTFARFASELGDQLANVEATIKKVAAALTIGITAPFAALSVASGRGAGAFEAAMGDVQAALRGLSPTQLNDLADAALKLGPAVGRSAVEAAEGIETLALTGLDAEQILNGAAEATLRLAAANDAELAPAAEAVTDVMAQFGLSVAALPRVVDQITGALDNSKFAFEDFGLAIAQAGGVAGNAGVSFDDFNTAIAGTSELFASGSDAGTSMKSFITSLNPKSEEAARVMKQLGIEFFDATGRMKDLADIAQILKDKLGGLSERSRTEALTKMFGTDAMRTAIGLMKVGKQGFEELQATIGSTDAGDKLAIQLTGLEAASDRASAGFERLKIALGTAGLLAAFTALQEGLASVATWLANLPPVFHSLYLVCGALAAAIGPLILVVMTLGRLALPLLLTRTGLLGKALIFLVNPIGAIAALLVRLAVVSTGAASAMTMLATRVAGVLGPLGLAVTALALLATGSDDASAAFGRLEAGADLAKSKLEEARSRAEAAGIAVNAMKVETAAAHPVMMGIASALGFAANEAMRYAESARTAAIASARLRLAQTKEDLSTAERVDRSRKTGNFLDREVPDLLWGPSGERLDAMVANGRAQIRAIEEEIRLLEKTPEAAFRSGAPEGGENVSFDKPDTPRKPKKPRAGKKDREDDKAYRLELLKLQQMLDVATARGDIEEENRLQDLLALKQREKEYVDLGLKAADAKVAAGRDLADLQAAEAVANAKAVELSGMENDLQAAQIRGDLEFIRQRENELFLRREIQELREKEVPLAEAEIEAASRLANIEAARLDIAKRLASERELGRQVELAKLRGDSEAAIRRLEYGPKLAQRTREIYDAGDGDISEDDAAEQARLELAEEDQARMTGQFREMFRGGFQAAMEGDFKGWFRNWLTDRFAKSFEDALNKLADVFSKALANALDQGGQPGGGNWLQSLGNAFASAFGLGDAGAGASGAVPSFGEISIPGFAGGGRPPLGRVSIIGEEGPELWVPDGPGTIIPNHEVGDWLSAGGSGGGEQPLHLAIYVDARDAVLTQQVKQWVADGVKQATADGALRGAVLAHQQRARRQA
jgi:TP901 family phage tail tape measure protein